jgi:hypothetical protein
MPFNRFDFEEQLMKVWSMSDQLNTITEGALEYNWTADQVSNATIGLKTMMDLEFDKLFNMFERGVSERNIV